MPNPNPTGFEFRWRGRDGWCFQWVKENGNPPIGIRVDEWVASVWIHGHQFRESGRTHKSAISKVRRILDNVRHAMRCTYVETEPSRRRRKVA